MEVVHNAWDTVARERWDGGHRFVAFWPWRDDRSGAEATYGHISTWDTHLVTDMSGLFEGYASFNDDISDWNVGAVTDMSSMFRGATKFNQDLTAWGERLGELTSETGITLSMTGMFNGATSFDQALGWCVDDVEADNAFEGTECEVTFCGFAQCSATEEGGTFCKLDDEYSCSGIPHKIRPPVVGKLRDEYRYAAPTPFDDETIVVGTENGTLKLYNRADVLVTLVEDDRFASVKVSGHATPTFVDIDGDGVTELVVGAEDGTLTLYKMTGGLYVLSPDGLFDNVRVPMATAAATTANRSSATSSWSSPERALLRRPRRSSTYMIPSPCPLSWTSRPLLTPYSPRRRRRDARRSHRLRPCRGTHKIKLPPLLRV